MRKPVFAVSDQVRLKPVCSATESTKNLGIMGIATVSIILFGQRTRDVQPDHCLCCLHSA